MIYNNKVFVILIASEGLLAFLIDQSFSVRDPQAEVPSEQQSLDKIGMALLWKYPKTTMKLFVITAVWTMTSMVSSNRLPPSIRPAC